MRLSPPGRRLRARLLFRVLTLVIAAVLGLGAFSAGCGSCRSRRGTGIYLEIPREVIVGANGARSLTLKIRIRAYDPAALPAGVPGVINDLPEQVIDLCPGTSCTPCASDDDCARDQFCEPSVLECRAAFEGRHGRSILIDPGTTPSGDPSPYDGIKAVVHFAVFADTTDDVRDAFAVIDDPFQQLLTCGSLPCSHAPLAALNALGAYSLSVDRLGHDDADIVMYPLNFDGVDVDPDGDTIPGQGAGPSEDGCVPFLRNPDYSWNSQRVNACESIFFIEPGTSDQSHFDCDDTSITANPFEVESGDVAIGRCIDGIDEDCRGGDGPCLDTDGDGFPGGPGADCNDADPDVHPGASELQCDNVDQDCNGADDCPDCDLDDDGYCVTAVGVIPGGDCCDAGTEAGCGGGVPPSAIHPGAPDVCGNGVDENCDGTQPICADPDADGDGFCSAEYDCGTDPTSGMDVCVVAGSDGGRPVCCLRRETIAPADLAACAGFDDCEDWDSSVHPGGSEICGNGVDDDCDPLTLDACPPGDADGDGFPAGPDCNDANPDVHPGAAERCGNGIDEDCSAGDGLCGPATDFDGDTYVVCPPGQTTGCDCDDANAMVHPDAPEQCDGVDSDCDGVVNNGNPEANDAGGDPLPCYGNDAVNPPYVEVNSEAWRCRVGDTVCTATGDLVCIHYVRPDLDAAGMPADACDDDNVCNGRNDVCLPCAAPSGPDVRTAERDLDGDGCFPCGGATNLASPVITAGDSCTGTDCCDEGTETGFPMCSPANAPTMNTTSPELCSNQGVDNNCDGNGAQICGTIVAGDACTTGIPGICSGGVFGCNAALGCSPGAPNTDVGQACGLFCNPTTCPYVTPELCDTPGIDNDCDGSTSDIDDEISPGVFAFKVSPACSPSAWSGDCACTASGACSICATDFWQCTGPAMPTCTAPSSPPAETCGGGDTDCNCVDDFTQDEMFGALCTAPGSYCDNTVCAAGCNSNGDCTNSNTCTVASHMCFCGINPPCTGSTTCNTGTGACYCGDTGSICGTSETCNGSMNCDCNGASNPTGEACVNSSAAPDCVAGTGCRCQASACGPSETCTGPGGDCNCSGTMAAVGEACTGTTPDCIAGTGCRCGEAGTLCGTNETCNGSSDCVCNVTVAPGGVGEACPDSSAAPDCVTGTGCRCQAAVCGVNETCTGPGGDCNCNGTTQATGEACIGTTPDCFAGVGCRCGDSSTVCGTNETCNGSGDCLCNATVAPGGTGEACPNSSTTAPDCVTGVGCRCQAALCGTNETCTGPGGDCSCNGFTQPTGEACIGASPDCFAGIGCRCGDSSSTCGTNETCNGSGDCVCNLTVAPGGTGEACPNASIAPDCVAGTGCRCETSTCGAGETCPLPADDCTCGGASSGSGEACTGTQNPDCNPGVGCYCAAAGAACGPGETCGAGGCTCGAGATLITNASGPACGGGIAACIAGVCDCDGSGGVAACGAREVCSGGGGVCKCGTLTAGAGVQACPDGGAGADNPECFPAVNGCHCGDSGTTCDSDENCSMATGGDCRCGTGSPVGTGPACLDSSTTAPDCVAASNACGCDASICGPNETCTAAGGDCQCGSNPPVGTGEACPSGPNPFCVSGNCRCGDAGTTCDSDEACSASDATGNCTCGTDSNATGPACPDADEYETCYGTACGCTPSPSDSCTAGFVCDMTTHECECNGNGDCDPLNAITGENCNVSDLCDCGTITCGFGAVCATTSTCTCTNGSCED